MEPAVSQLTIFFEDPFWVGVYERRCQGPLEVCKITFGAEPKDGEVYNFLLKNWDQLRFGPSIEAKAPPSAPSNPKRMQRQIKKQLQSAGVGTKAQQALKLQQAQGKCARQRRTRAMRAAEKERQLALHQQKRREKHKGH